MRFGLKPFEQELNDEETLKKLGWWFYASSKFGVFDPMTLTDPMAVALVRLEGIQKGEDPVVKARESARFFTESEAEWEWEDALEGGSGYRGERGKMKY